MNEEKNKNSDLKLAEDLAAKKLEIEDIRSEVKTLQKMLKNGFANKTNGMEKAVKILASGDTKKISKLYAEVANTILALQLTNNLNKLSDFLSYYLIKVEAETQCPYTSKKKRKSKFDDLYNSYFIEESPQKGHDAAIKILSSLNSLYSEISQKDDAIKEEKESIEPSCSKRTFNTLTKIIVTSSKNDLPLEDVIATVESKLSEEQQAIDILEQN